MSANKLTRSVYLEGFLLAEGTEVTDEQRAKLKNPKLFAEPADATGPDANDAREYQKAVITEADPGRALRAPDKSDDDKATTDDRAAAGAKLARGSKAVPPAAPAATA
jgi:hypothetical protein